MSRLQRNLIGILLCSAVIVAICTGRYFTDPRKGPLRRILYGSVGGLALWGIYATIAWHAVSHQ